MMRHAVAAEGLRSAPPVSLTILATIEAITLDKWVAIATLSYVILQMGYLVWKWIREYRASR